MSDIVHSAEVIIDASGAASGAETASRAFEDIAKAADSAKEPIRLFGDSTAKTMADLKASADASKGPIRLLGTEMPTSFKKSTEGAKGLGTSVAGLTNQLKMLAVAFGGYKLYAFGKDAMMVAARYEELGIVVREVGKRAGVSSVALLDAESGLRKYGIEATETREQLLKFIQANLDLSKATQLARVAQDAAVVGGLNSSQTLQRITHGIVSGQSEVLRTVGITVNFEQEYKKMAKEVGTSVGALTNAQRTQARMNAVMKEGARLSGAYEASMQSASKQMRTWPRYIEDIKVALGSAYGGEMKKAVFLISDFLKGTAKFIEDHKLAIALVAKFTVTLAELAVVLGVVKVAMVAFNAVAAANIWVKGAVLAATAISAAVTLVKSSGIKKEQEAAAATEGRLKAYKKRYDDIVEKVAPRKESDPLRQSVVKDLTSEYNRTNTVIAQKLAERNTAIAKAKEKEAQLLAARNVMARQLGAQAVSSETEIGVALAAAQQNVLNLLSDGTKKNFDKSLEEIRAAADVTLGFLRKLGVGVPASEAPDTSATDEARDRFKELVKDLEKYEREVKTTDPFFSLREGAREMGDNFVEAGKKAGKSAAEITGYVTRIGRSLQTQLTKEQTNGIKELSKGFTENSISLTNARTKAIDEANALKGLATATAQGEAAVQRYNEARQREALIEQYLGEKMSLNEARLRADNVIREQRNLSLAQNVNGLRDEADAQARAAMEYEKATDDIIAQAAATAGGTKELRAYSQAKEADRLKSITSSAEEARLMVARRAAAEEVMRRAAESAEKTRQIGENLTRGLQESLSGFFEGLFTKGLQSWQDFMDRIRQLFTQMLAQLLSSSIMKRFMSVMRGDDAGANGLLKGSMALMGMLPGGKANVDALNFGDISNAAISLGGMGGAKGGGLSSIFGKPIISSSGGALGMLAQAAGGALAGGMIGYGIGYSSGNKTTGVLGGAAGGAAAGAAMGGVPGAIAGAIIGGVAGWFGASKKAKEVAKQLDEAQKAFARSLDDWHRTATGTTSAVVSELKRAEAQREALRKEANAAMPGKKYESRRNAALSQIDRDYALIREQIITKYRESLQGAIESLRGDDWSAQFRALEDQLREFRQAALEGYLSTADVEAWYILAKKKLDDAKARDERLKTFATEDFNAQLAQRKAALGGNTDEAARIDIERNKQRELLSLRDMLDAGTITTEMFEEMARVIGDEAVKALADYTKAIAEQKQQVSEDLAVRRAVAQRMGDDELEQLQLSVQQRRELVDVTDEALRQEILRTQALEKQALIQAQAERATQRMEDLNLRAMQASGVVTDDEIARRQLEIQQRRELVGVTDDALKWQLLYVQGLEREALARQLAERARQQQEDIRLRTLRASGSATDDQLEMLQLEISQRRELVGVTDAAIAAQLAYVQGLEKEVLLKQQAERKKQHGENLELRRMQATGVDADEIEKRRQEIEQRRELVGVTDAVLRAQIEYVQGLEREALARQIAEASRQRSEDRELRWMRARGATEEAIEKKRREIEQRRELRLAVNDAEREELKRLHAAENDYWNAQQAAAAGRAAIEAATKGSTTGALQTATVSQADRMIALLEAIAANTSALRGGFSGATGTVAATSSVDTLLGSSLLSQRRLTGNTRVEIA